jgi:glycosyltransferase involved in cell wall biosynthesis
MCSIGPSRPRRLLPVAAGPRMRVLSVLSSSNQMYSGIGRAVFELTARLTERIDFEIAIDDRNRKNLDLVMAFGLEHDIPVHVGPGLDSPRSLDTYSSDLPELLARDDWDLVEAICWANSATNAAVLRDLGDRTLVYTPHYQPTWTAMMTPEVASFADDIHHLARRADAVLCVSPRERSIVQAQTHGRNNCQYVPNGVNASEFQPGPTIRKPQLLFVGDLAEPRKRFDRVLAILPRLLASRPDLKLVVVGNGSDRAVDAIPLELRPACDLRGYVDEVDLRTAYAESQGVFLLSDYEAFGLPILEALISGTPVFLTDLDVTRSLFDTYRGAKFCPVEDLEATYEILSRTLSQGPDAILETLADRPRLAAAFDWDALAIRKWQVLAAAWFTRHYIDRPFQGPAVARSAIAARGGLGRSARGGFANM